MATVPARTNPNNVVKADPADTIFNMLQRSRGQLQSALPAYMSPERMVRVAMTTIRSSRDLLACTPISLTKCLIQCAQLNLEPDPLLGHVYIVPYKQEASVIIGYKGIVILARRSGQIANVQAQVVYEADQFEYEFGSNERLIHRPAFQKNRGGIRYAWAMATSRDGSREFDVMDWWELEAIRLRSPARNRGPWVDDTPQMYRKCPIRRLGKMLPLSPVLQRQLAAEEMLDAGHTVTGLVDYDDPEAPQLTSSENDKLLSRMGDDAPDEPGSDG